MGEVKKMCPLGNLKQSMSNVNMLRKQMNVKQIAEDTADFIIYDLEKKGFKAKLEKNNSKKPKNWKIIPIEKLTPEQQKEFEQIKNEKRDFYFTRTKEQIKQMKKAILGGKK